MGKLSAYYHLTKPGAVLRVTGPDAFTFLQSQFSNDLRRPGVERPVTYGLWLNQKGKIQADSFVIQRGAAEFLLVSYDCPAETIKAHLESHLIADEVEVADETGEFGLMHVFAQKNFNTASDEEIPEMGRQDPWSMLKLSHDTEVMDWVGRRPDQVGQSRDYLGVVAALKTLANGLAENDFRKVDRENISFFRIGGGVPSIPQDAGSGDLPQEAGLERDAVSFTKGCFLGQEVMARLKSQGQVNRALWRVQTKGDVPLPEGSNAAPLYAGDVIAGELRSRSGCIGLAMLKKRAIAGREGLSLTPGGEEVVSLKAEHCAVDLTASVT
jgi:hypothetical protein